MTTKEIITDIALGAGLIAGGYGTYKVVKASKSLKSRLIIFWQELKAKKTTTANNLSGNQVQNQNQQTSVVTTAPTNVATNQSTMTTNNIIQYYDGPWSDGTKVTASNGCNFTFKVLGWLVPPGWPWDAYNAGIRKIAAVKAVNSGWQGTMYVDPLMFPKGSINFVPKGASSFGDKIWYLGESF